MCNGKNRKQTSAEIKRVLHKYWYCQVFTHDTRKKERLLIAIEPPRDLGNNIYIHSCGPLTILAGTTKFVLLVTETLAQYVRSSVWNRLQSASKAISVIHAIFAAN
jgi:hypothetical protein